jgi:mannose-6-phosphate isomerase-like protein (cupin superfamily)
MSQTVIGAVAMSNLYNPRLKFPEREQIAPGVSVYSPLSTTTTSHPTVEINYFSVLPDCVSPLDQHEEQEYWIILSGQGELQCAQQSYAVKAQDVFYFAAHISHQIKNTGQDTMLICSVYW